MIFEVQLATPTPDEERRVYHESVDQALLAEQVGFDRVWAVEHHNLRYYAHCSNAPDFLAWALPNAGRIEEAQKLVTDLEQILQKKESGSMQIRLLEQLAYYPLVFELAMTEGNLDRATEVAEWFANEGMDARAGILYLRLDDPRANEYLARDPEPRFDRLFWSFAT